MPLPITAASLLEAAGLEPSGRTPWRQPVRSSNAGVYVIELAVPADGDAGAGTTAFPRPPLDLGRIEAWLRRAPRLRLDGRRPTALQLADRLAEFWWPESRVVYVGCTGGPLGKRLAAFYRHQLGSASPHRGGQWLMALDPAVQLDVAWVETGDADVTRIEAELLATFRWLLRRMAPAREDMESSRRLPFANLREPDGGLKPHGISTPGR